MLSIQDTKALYRSALLKSSIILFLLLIAATHVISKEAHGRQLKVCDLITQDDAAKILGTTVSTGVSRNTMMPAGQSCRYTYQMSGSVYGVTVRVSTDEEIKEEGFNDSATDLMSKQKKARTDHAYAATTYKELASLADDAFWNGTDLWVLKGRALIIVKSNGYLGGAFKNTDEARKAAETRNLQYSRDIVKVIISRL